MSKKQFQNDLSNKDALPAVFQNVCDTVRQASEDYKIELLEAVLAPFFGPDVMRKTPFLLLSAQVNLS